MQAFHNDPAIKANILARIVTHHAADEIFHWTYWENIMTSFSEKEETMQILAPAKYYILRVIDDDGTHYAIGDLTFGRARLMVGHDWLTWEEAW